MDDFKFQKLIIALGKIYQDCNDVVMKIHNFDELPLNQARTIQAEAIRLHSLQDKLFNVELYHIIYMGQLTDEQLIDFIKTVRCIGDTRTIIKLIASKHDLGPLPEIMPAKYDSILLKETLIKE